DCVIFNDRAGTARDLNEQGVERVACHLVAECPWSEGLYAFACSTPMHGVAGGSQETRVVHRLPQAQLVEQFRATRRKRLGQRMSRRGTREEEHGSAPSSQLAGRRRTGWSAADHGY